MKYILFILLFFLCLSCSHRPVQEVDTVSYRGWENCLKLSNRAVSVIVNPTYGGPNSIFRLRESWRLIYCGVILLSTVGL